MASKPFDAALKHLLEAYPRDWLRLVGLSSAGTVTVIDADLSTISAEADKVLRIDATESWLVHFELQASYDPQLGERALRYNSLLRGQHGVSVQSVVILLRPQADGSGMTGRVEGSLPDGRRYLDFRYDLVRIWQLPVEKILEAGLGTLPLAPLADGGGVPLPEIVRCLDDRLSAEAAMGESASLLTASFLLMGLRYRSELVATLFSGVRSMKESSTYQAILTEGRELGKAEGNAEGRAEEARKLLLAVGRKRFGLPNTKTLRNIDAITDLARLEQLAERVLAVSNWEELLSTA